MSTEGKLIWDEADRKYELIWEETDRKLDEQARECIKEAKQALADVKKLYGCKYRKDTDFYRISCLHPDRRPGRLCLNTSCPVLFDSSIGG